MRENIFIATRSYLHNMCVYISTYENTYICIDKYSHFGGVFVFLITVKE